MPKKPHKIKKRKVKEGILQGKSYKQAMIDAGYKDTTAHKSSMNKVVKVCLKEIEQDFKDSDLTVDMVITGLLSTIKLAISKEDYSTVARCWELLGKRMALFTDKQQIVDEYDESEFYKSLFPNRLGKIEDN